MTFEHRYFWEDEYYIIDTEVVTKTDLQAKA